MNRFEGSPEPDQPEFENKRDFFKNQNAGGTKEYPENPSAEIITDLTNKYEDECILQEIDPELRSRSTVLMQFLISRNIMGDLGPKYERLIQEELKKRYPKGQTEFDFRG
jgi:hypothetical protein